MNLQSIQTMQQTYTNFSTDFFTQQVDVFTTGSNSSNNDFRSLITEKSSNTQDTQKTTKRDDTSDTKKADDSSNTKKTDDTSKKDDKKTDDKGEAKAEKGKKSEETTEGEQIVAVMAPIVPMLEIPVMTEQVEDYAVMDLAGAKLVQTQIETQSQVILSDEPVMKVNTEVATPIMQQATEAVQQAVVVEEVAQVVTAAQTVDTTQVQTQQQAVQTNEQAVAQNIQQVDTTQQVKAVVAQAVEVEVPIVEVSVEVKVEPEMETETLTINKVVTQEVDTETETDTTAVKTEVDAGQEVTVKEVSKDTVVIKVADGQLNENWQRVSDEISKQVVAKQTAGVDKFSIVLDPQGLGKINVEITQDQGSMKVLFTCSSQATADLLSDNMTSLARVIESNFGSDSTVQVHEDANEANQQKDMNHQNSRGGEQQQGKHKETEDDMMDFNFAERMRLGLVNLESF